MPRPPRPRAVVFDAYGTLLDVHSAIARRGARLGDQGAAISALWRAKQLEYTWILSTAGDYEPFDRITDRALGHALAVHGVNDAGLRADLLAAYRSLDAFPDAAGTLDALQGSGLVTAVLSNGEPEMLAEGLAHAGLSSRLDQVLSVDPLRCYKPAPDVYRLPSQACGCQPHEIAFVSANAWDAYGAARFGFRVFWLNRAAGPIEYWLDALATPIAGLSALPAAFAP